FLGLVAVLVPLPVMLLGCLVILGQTLVFTLLTSIYISLATEHEAHSAALYCSAICKIAGCGSVSTLVQRSGPRQKRWQLARKGDNASPLQEIIRTCSTRRRV